MSILNTIKSWFFGDAPKTDSHPLDGATRRAMEAEAPYKIEPPLEPPTLNESGWPFPTSMPVEGAGVVPVTAMTPAKKTRAPAKPKAKAPAKTTKATAKAPAKTTKAKPAAKTKATSKKS